MTEWTTRKANLLWPENLEKVRLALKAGPVFGLHCHFCAGCGPDGRVFQSYDAYVEYFKRPAAPMIESPGRLRDLELPYPGDLFVLWSAAALHEQGLSLVHLPSRNAMDKGKVDDAAAQTKRFLKAEKYNEVICAFTSQFESKCCFNDIDGFDQIEADLRRYAQLGGEVFVFSLTEIDKENSPYYLLQAKYPNEKGEVPIGGAY